MFLCPRFRAWLCDLARPNGRRSSLLFLCFRFRAWLCDNNFPDISAFVLAFLCPRFRAWLCDPARGKYMLTPKGRKEAFLCPRFRAVLCDDYTVESASRALGVSMPSVSGCALRPSGKRLGHDFHNVSMPSVSGCALRQLELTDALNQAQFLCPRFRAVLCDGCLLAAPAACGFRVRSAIRGAERAPTALLRALTEEPSRDQAQYARQPPRKMPPTPPALYRLIPAAARDPAAIAFRLTPPVRLQLAVRAVSIGDRHGRGVNGV
jgi:hypothetical protein